MDEAHDDRGTRVSLAAGPEMQGLFGRGDQHARLVEDELGVQFVLRNGFLTISGSEAAVARAGQVVGELLGMVRQGREVGGHEVRLALRHFGQEKSSAAFRQVQAQTIDVSPKKRSVRPKSPGQARYVEAIRSRDIVFGIGPAGTGKTYLAMALAVSFLLQKRVSRIILTRPAVEAGEKLGYLPGTLAEKINPYLRPLYDALYDMLEAERAARLMEQGTIEIAPLAFMRGRTLNESFIILDEAQNTTSEQMKMFLTRLGFGSRAVVTGDITQVDLPAGRVSGLIEVRAILKDVPGLQFVQFGEEDVVRHELVQRIVHAYEAYQGAPADPGA
jgi:phosphate starvation-inducible protein PhoH and related proteins